MAIRFHTQSSPAEDKTRKGRLIEEMRVVKVRYSVHLAADVMLKGCSQTFKVVDGLPEDSVLIDWALNDNAGELVLYFAHENFDTISSTREDLVPERSVTFQDIP